MQIEAWGFPCLGLLSSVVSPATATEPYRVSNGIALLLSVAPAQMTGITYDTCSSSIILFYFNIFPIQIIWILLYNKGTAGYAAHKAA